uniref:Uncharacterized protein n=1 Tax=Ignisphaera aggregans TaxID=334771 RepID=A0A7J3ZAE9_9CREN
MTFVDGCIIKSRELKNLAFVFVNDYFLEDDGELLGIRVDFLNGFRVLPVNFDADEIRHGVYLFIAGKRVLSDRVRRGEVSEEEVFAGNEKG